MSAEKQIQPTFPGPGDVPVDAPGVSMYHEGNLPEDLRTPTDLLAEGSEGPREVGEFSKQTIIATQRLEGTPMVVVLPDHMDPRMHPEVSTYGKLLRDQEAAERQQRQAAFSELTSRFLGSTTTAEVTVPTNSKPELVLANDVDSPELAPQHGAVAADVLTLRLAAEEVQAVTGKSLTVPEIAGGDSEILESLAKVSYNPSSLEVTASIDTGKLTWERPATEGTLTAYSGETKQSAMLGKGNVVIVDGHPVSNGAMLLPDGRKVELWFSDVGTEETQNRYGLVEKASALTQRFRSSGARADYAKRTIPATQVGWKDSMPEIVAANAAVLNSAKQEVRFAVDYTGARAAASTTLGLRSGDMTPTVTFGEKGPVMYWITEEGGDLPFAVTHTTPEVWLEPGQRPDFDFSGN